MMDNKLIDGIVPEPLGGAHYDPQSCFDTLKENILKNLQSLSKFSAEELVSQRQEKFIAMGEFSG